ncbi:16S rRNA (uracil(1498)-N(3))-methyltransferase [Candidatus Finniella inopinata]|uniref:Ribosomal RNA small subunit methyltransferase E n=1 Tax=Candidatus Finniella inopinata TaxID=1696036 RepID=A0A4Q7DH01_9PROT|nr:16S rRNA (uracil(1498)-N(3))-methyltransferase [Candidatus Finniella inopinata]RZI46063.1 16S rRNA (uracil(1498)-N(3))-methyltransferase [Candidatus Finniella inopinata]
MPRLYLNQPLTEKTLITLSLEQSHYLLHVLRQRAGDKVTVFNAENGDWSAVVRESVRKQIVLEINSQIKPAVPTNPLWLAFAPLKQEATNFVLEKATELGVTHVQPLWMDHSNTQRLNEERWQKIMIEAAEQCERQDIPVLLPSLKLMDFLGNLPSEPLWFVALERSDQTPLLSALQKKPQGPYGFIIGPEGGFSAVEQQAFRQHPSLQIISLGWRVLRAETAALTVLAVAQSV